MLPSLQPLSVCAITTACAGSAATTVAITVRTSCGRHDTFICASPTSWHPGQVGEAGLAAMSAIAKMLPAIDITTCVNVVCPLTATWTSGLLPACDVTGVIPVIATPSVAATWVSGHHYSCVTAAIATVPMACHLSPPRSPSPLSGLDWRTPPLLHHCRHHRRTIRHCHAACCCRRSSSPGVFHQHYRPACPLGGAAVLGRRASAYSHQPPQFV